MIDSKYIAAVDEVPDDQLREQIELRRELIANMVGNLYPLILVDEVEKLKTRLKAIKDR